MIALVEDLLFLSRIREAARGSGLEVSALRGIEEVAAAAAGGAALVLVDADSDRLPWPAALDRLRAEPALAEVPVVAFLSHVRRDRAEAARAHGATRVLARSAFVQELSGLLANAAGGPPSQERNP
ncbi:MAG TPA: hypothetical protein VMX54_21695 [Vicinamibacteria bacterium]|nr:hypothetical protein [Vicinamibacteria bacterium]